MEWFKHKTSAHIDPVVSDAWDEFGDAGYVIWFVLLEVYGQQYNSSKPDKKLDVSKAFLQRKFRKSWAKVERVLNYYAEFDKLDVKINGKRVFIGIPKFTEILSNWTKRQVNQPTESPTESPTAKTRVRVDKEKDKEKEKQFKAFALPDKETIKDAAERKIYDDIDMVCKKLYDDKIFPKVHAYKNTQLKKTKNARAVLHVLSRCYLKKTFDNGPWAYCEKIMQVENGNYNESDYTKAAP